LKCPKCGFIQSDKYDACKKCGKELQEYKKKLGITQSAGFPFSTIAKPPTPDEIKAGKADTQRWITEAENKLAQEEKAWRQREDKLLEQRSEYQAQFLQTQESMAKKLEEERAKFELEKKRLLELQIQREREEAERLEAERRELQHKLKELEEERKRREEMEQELAEQRAKAEAEKRRLEQDERQRKSEEEARLAIERKRLEEERKEIEKQRDEEKKNRQRAELERLEREIHLAEERRNIQQEREAFERKKQEEEERFRQEKEALEREALAAERKKLDEEKRNAQLLAEQLKKAAAEERAKIEALAAQISQEITAANLNEPLTARSAQSIEVATPIKGKKIAEADTQPESQAVFREPEFAEFGSAKKKDAEPAPIEEAFEEDLEEAGPLIVPKAGFWIRFAAGIVDFGLLLGVLMLFVVAGGLAVSARSAANTAGLAQIMLIFSTPAYLLFCILGALASTYFIGSMGQTPGMMIFHLKAVDFSGRTIGYSRALLRYAIKLFSLALFFMGLLWIGLDINKQGWHDKLAHCVVIQV